MRTIVNLSDWQIEALGRIARRRRLSRAELIRRVVNRYLVEHAAEHGPAFGRWQRAGACEDGLTYERRLRREWGR